MFEAYNTSLLPKVNVELPSPESLRLLTNTDLTGHDIIKKEAETKEPIASNKKLKDQTNKNSPGTIKTWVVGGVFVIKDNAEKKVALMKNLGFPKAKLIAFDDRYYACYGEASGEQEEINLRKKVAQVDPFAWTKR